LEAGSWDRSARSGSHVPRHKHVVAAGLAAD
jgi:hypothetical protein